MFSLLRMDNDSIFKFKADTTLSKKSGSGAGAILGITANISDKQLEFIMIHIIKSMRLGLTDDNVGVDLPFLTDKLRKQAQKAATYILSGKD